MDIRWDQLTKRQWQALLAPHYYGLRQDWDFGAAMQTFGASVARAVVYDDGQAVAMAQVLQRRGLRVLGQGPVWLVPTPICEQRHVIRRLSCYIGASVVTPPSPVSGWGMVPLVTPNSHAHWSIGVDTTSLRRGLQGKWRNRLVRAEEVVRPKPLNRQQRNTLIDLEAATRRMRGYSNIPGGLANIWTGESLALGWHSGGALQAGMVFLIHGKTASYFTGWASAVARKAFAHGPILWQSALILRARGVSLLDLGDVNTETGKNLARFKLGTGAAVSAAGATCLVMPGR